MTETEDLPAIGLKPSRPRRWFAWSALELRHAMDGPIVSNAAALYGATIISAVLGFGYWFIAARLVSARDVGIASAVQSGAQFLGVLCVIGLSTLVISELSIDKTHARSLLLTATIWVGGVAGVVSIAVGIGVQTVPSTFRDGIRGPLGILVFTILGTLTTVLILLDDACVGLLRGDLQLSRNAVFAVSKLVLLPILVGLYATQSGLELVLAWTTGMAISLLSLGYQLRKATSGQSSRPMFMELFRKRRLMASHHWLNISINSTRLLLPVLAAVIIGASANAAFTAAFLVVSFVNVIPVQLSTVLFALAPGDELVLRRQVRKTMRICVAVSIASAVFFLIFGGLILRIFGHDYEIARVALIILGLTTYPQSIKAHYVAIARVRGQMQQAAFRTSVGACLEVGLAATGAILYGLTGLALGYLAAGVIEGVLFAPTVYGVLRAAHAPKRRLGHGASSL